VHVEQPGDIGGALVCILPPGRGGADIPYSGTVRNVLFLVRNLLPPSAFGSAWARIRHWGWIMDIALTVAGLVLLGIAVLTLVGLLALGNGWTDATDG
jgi:hypothetical protein